MSENSFEIQGQVVDVLNRRISSATVSVRDGVIESIEPIQDRKARSFVMPGFVDSHIHIESSMLLPSQFARAAVIHGTVATVSDPHEIANVCGIAGIELMLKDAAQTAFKFHFGAPACVPATNFETAGAEIDSVAVANLLARPEIGYLSEMMDFPGVLSGSVEVMAKIAASKGLSKPVDGHAPGLRGEDARNYFAAGITTDHECVTLDEAIDKIAAGCKIAIREGSAARNFAALESLLDSHPERCMFCSDDKHPEELMLGHVNKLAARAVALGRDLMNVLQACSVNAVKHYGMGVGLLQVGDPADFVVVKDLKDFAVLETYIDGTLVAKDGKCLMVEVEPTTINQFAATPITASDLVVSAKTSRVRVIEAVDGELITNSIVADTKVENGLAVSDVDNDVLKIVVLNRYSDAKPSIAFVKGFQIKNGAFASSVAHDSHNILSVGVTDVEIAGAINGVIESQGGLSVAAGDNCQVLPLPVAGLMATDSCKVVAENYLRLDRQVKELGCVMRAPFMTLSFLALLVIPSLKVSDQGLFDVERFEFTNLFV